MEHAISLYRNTANSPIVAKLPGKKKPNATIFSANADTKQATANETAMLRITVLL